MVFFDNRQRVTLASFLAYFVMSGMLAPIGIILQPMAEHFGLPVAQVGAKFGWLTFGILAGSSGALLAFDWLSVRRVMLIAYAAVALCLLLLGLTQHLAAVRAALAVVGVCCGVGLAAAASTIASVYAQERRASMLVITDACFSVAGILCSWIAVALVARGVHWSGTYQFVAGVALLVVALALASSFSDDDSRPSNREGALLPALARYPLPVWLCIAALFLYTLGQYSMLWWLPNHLETALSVPRARAGEVVGQFWSGMLVAQVFVAWWVLRIGVRRLALIGAASTFACSLPLWLYTDIDGLLVLAFLWGLANLGLLKIIISFGTTMVEQPTPRLVSALLLGGTLGTSVSPPVTSGIAALASPLRVLQFSSGCYLAVALLLLAAARLSAPGAALPAARPVTESIE